MQFYLLRFFTDFVKNFYFFTQTQNFFFVKINQLYFITKLRLRSSHQSIGTLFACMYIFAFVSATNPVYSKTITLFVLFYTVNNL